MKLTMHCFLPLLGLATALPAAQADVFFYRAAALAGPNSADEEHGNKFYFHPRGAAREMETITFLGVESAPVTPELAAQLALPAGTGLVVEQIVPGSPAAAAIQPFDILVKLDDQWLIDPHQFSVLVRNHKDGDSVIVTYIRAGKQATTVIKLAQHEAPKLSRDDERRPGFPGFNFAFPGPGGPSGFDREEMDRMLALMDRDQMKGPPRPPREAPAASAPGAGMSALNVDPANSSLAYSDTQGTLDLTIKDGKQSLVAKDPQGKELYAGPVDTPEQRKALPPQVRDRLEKLENMSGVSFKTGDDFKGKTRVFRPEGQGIALPFVPRAESGQPAAF